MKICEEKLVENELSSVYNEVQERYDDLLDRHDIVSHTQISIKKGEHICACNTFTLREFLLQISNPSLGRSHIQDDMLIWSHHGR